MDFERESQVEPFLDVVLAAFPAGLEDEVEEEEGVGPVSDMVGGGE